MNRVVYDSLETAPKNLLGGDTDNGEKQDENYKLSTGEDA